MARSSPRLRRPRPRPRRRCRRWSPKAAPDGTDGVLLDVRGCALLWGEEAALLADVGRRLGRLGLTARAALAGRRLAALPAAALRVGPELEAALGRLGLRTVAGGAGGRAPAASVDKPGTRTLPQRPAVPGRGGRVVKGSRL